jgi:phosphatidylglycerophosphatase B
VRNSDELPDIIAFFAVLQAFRQPAINERNLAMQPPRAPVKNVLWRLCGVMLAAGALLPLTYFLPPTDLTGPLAQAAFWISESGGVRGTPVVAIGMTFLVLSRAGLSWKRRGAELLVIVLALAILFGGAAYLNEYVVKPFFAVPRPDIVELAAMPPEAPVLKMSAEQFYALPTKALRREYLKTVLTPDVPPAMSARIRGHWIVETGYSFPSGHSFSAMMFAIFFLALGLRYCSTPRLWAFYVLVAWAVAVCYSRPILRLHSPLDICVGAAEGMVGGVVAFLFVYWVLEWPTLRGKGTTGAAAS